MRNDPNSIKAEPKGLTEIASVVILTDSIIPSDLTKIQEAWENRIKEQSPNSRNSGTTGILNTLEQYEKRAAPFKKLIQDVKLEQSSSKFSLSRFFESTGIKNLKFEYPRYDTTSKLTPEEYNNKLANLEKKYFSSAMEYFKSVLGRSNPSKYTVLVQRIQNANSAARLSPGFNVKVASPLYKFVTEMKGSKKFQLDPVPSQEQPKFNQVKEPALRTPDLAVTGPPAPVRNTEFRRVR